MTDVGGWQQQIFDSRVTDNENERVREREKKQKEGGRRERQTTATGKKNKETENRRTTSGDMTCEKSFGLRNIKDGRFPSLSLHSPVSFYGWGREEEREKQKVMIKWTVVVVEVVVVT